MMGETLFGTFGNAVLLAWAILAASMAFPPTSAWAKRLSKIGGLYAPGGAVPLLGHSALHSHVAANTRRPALSAGGEAEICQPRSPSASIF